MALLLYNAEMLDNSVAPNAREERSRLSGVTQPTDAESAAERPLDFED
jgi:hypothetical protein